MWQVRFDRGTPRGLGVHTLHVGNVLQAALRRGDLPFARVRGRRWCAWMGRRRRGSVSAVARGHFHSLAGLADLVQPPVVVRVGWTAAGAAAGVATTEEACVVAGGA